MNTKSEFWTSGLISWQIAEGNLFIKPKFSGRPFLEGL